MFQFFLSFKGIGSFVLRCLVDWMTQLYRYERTILCIVHHGYMGLLLATIVSQEIRALIAFSVDEPH